MELDENPESILNKIDERQDNNDDDAGNNIQELFLLNFYKKKAVEKSQTNNNNLREGEKKDNKDVGQKIENGEKLIENSQDFEENEEDLEAMDIEERMDVGGLIMTHHLTVAREFEGNEATKAHDVNVLLNITSQFLIFIVVQIFVEK